MWQFRTMKLMPANLLCFITLLSLMSAADTGSRCRLEFTGTPRVSQKTWQHSNGAHVKVDWRGALRGANCVKTYFVMFRESSGHGQPWDARRVEGQTEADLYGLKASQSYMVRVAALAVERGGDGCCFAEGVPQKSQEVEFVTGQVGGNCWPYEEELPNFEGPPTVEEVSPTMVRVSWDPLPVPWIPTCGVSIDCYLMHWPKGDPLQSIPIRVKNCSSSHFVSVEEGEVREFQVEARAMQESTGRSETVRSPLAQFATEVEVTTVAVPDWNDCWPEGKGLPDFDENPPAVEQVSPTMVRLSWDPFPSPTRTCRISLIYAVKHWPKKDPSQLVTVASTESNLLVDVEEGEERVFQVSARAEQASTGRMDEVKSPVAEFATKAEGMATTSTEDPNGVDRGSDLSMTESLGLCAASRSSWPLIRAVLKSLNDMLA